MQLVPAEALAHMAFLCRAAVGCLAESWQGMEIAITSCVCERDRVLPMCDGSLHGWAHSGPTVPLHPGCPWIADPGRSGEWIRWRISPYFLFLMLFMQMFVTSQGGRFARLPFGLTQRGASSLLPCRRVVPLLFFHAGGLLSRSVISTVDGQKGRRWTRFVCLALLHLTSLAECVSGAVLPLQGECTSRWSPLAQGTAKRANPLQSNSLCVAFRDKLEKRRAWNLQSISFLMIAFVQLND